jgi:hypothetical protein
MRTLTASSTASSTTISDARLSNYTPTCDAAVIHRSLVDPPYLI